MQVNTALQNKVDIMKGDAVPRIPCMRCESVEATLDCEECNVKYCSTCSDLVHTGQLKLHRLKYNMAAVQGANRAPYCDIPGHNDYRTDLYCTDCNVLLCVVCAQTSSTHRSHHVVPLSEAAEVEKVKLRQTLEAAGRFRGELREVSNSLDRALDANERSTQEEIEVFERTISSLIGYLEERRAKLVDQAKHIHLEEAAKCRRAKEQVVSLASKLNETVASCQRAMTLSSNVDIITGRVAMEQQLSQHAPIVLPQSRVPQFHFPHYQAIMASIDDSSVSIEETKVTGPVIPNAVLEPGTIFRQRGFKLNKSTYGEIQLFNRGLSASSNARTWETVMADTLLTQGLHYFEVRLDQYDTTNGHNVIIGLVFDGVHEMCEVIGEDSNSCGFDTGRGTKTVNGDFYQPYSDPCAQGDVIGVKIDYQDRTVEFFKNAVSQGIAFTGLSRSAYVAVSLINNQQVTLMFPMKVPL